MIFDAIFGSFEQIFTPPFRRVLLKTLALTLLLLVVVFVAAEKLVVHMLAVPSAWLTASIAALAGIALSFGFAFAIAPVSFVVGSFFFDQLAAIVEKEIDPARPGVTPPFAEEALLGAKFAALALVLNLVALFLLLVPGVNALVFTVVNGYLFGRGYFEFAALRYRQIEDVARVRQGHAWQIFLAGLAIATFAAVPIANLLTPLFGAAVMVRLHNAFSRQEAARPKR